MRKRVRANRWKSRGVLIAAVALLLPGPQALLASDFADELARVDRALSKNPSRVHALALKSCRARRNAAVRHYDKGQLAQAERRLKYCFQVLKIPEPSR